MTRRQCFLCVLWWVMSSWPFSLLLYLAPKQTDRSYVSYYKLCYKKLSLPQVLTQTQNEFIISTDHKTNVKTGLYKVDCPCELNIKDTLESNLCAHHQYRTAFEDLTNANLHKLDQSTLLNSLRKCCDYMNQRNSINFNNKGHKLHRNRDQQENLLFYPLEECINLAITMLLLR